MSARSTIARLQFKTLQIPFKEAFRHASAERTETLSVWVRAEAGGLVGHGESCPRSYVTGETIDSAQLFFEEHEASVRTSIHDRATLEAWVGAHATEIDEHPAAWCAIELAILDLLGKTSGHPVEAVLSRPALEGRFQYSAVLGDASPEVFRATSGRYVALGFKDFKVKLSGDCARDREKLDALRARPGIRVRGDANNLWDDAAEAIEGIASLDFPFFAIEEPIAPNQYGELVEVARALDTRIVLDESFLRIQQLAALADHPHAWIVNVRVSKMGGVLRSLAIVDRICQTGTGLIVGAQVGETSLLTRAALTVAKAAGRALVAQEGAFGTFLLERDICDPPLMFGKGGVLDASAHERLTGAGWGL